MSQFGTIAVNTDKEGVINIHVDNAFVNIDINRRKDGKFTETTTDAKTRVLESPQVSQLDGIDNITYNPRTIDAETVITTMKMYNRPEYSHFVNNKELTVAEYSKEIMKLEIKSLKLGDIGSINTNLGFNGTDEYLEALKQFKPEYKKQIDEFEKDHKIDNNEYAKIQKMAEDARNEVNNSESKRHR